MYACISIYIYPHLRATVSHEHARHAMRAGSNRSRSSIIGGSPLRLASQPPANATVR